MDRRIVALTTMLSLALFGSTAFAQDEVAEEAGGDEMGGEEAGGGDDMGGEEAGGGGDMGGGEMSTDDDGFSAGGDEGPSKPISVGLLLGYGLSLEDGGNAWGLGFGVGGGYTLDMGLYLGARFVYWLGDSEDVSAGGMTFESSMNIWNLGLDVGYVVDLGGAALRPQLGLGLANFSADTTVLGVSVSASEMYIFIAPGAALTVDVSDSIFIGADVTFQLVMADPDMVKALTLLANGGMRF